MAKLPAKPHVLGRLGVLIIVTYALAIIFALLGFRSTLTEHEVFAAEPAREMLEGGSIVLQQFAGEYRTKKPPGQSWLISASLLLTQSRGEYAARLPSAIAATALALLAGGLGARLLSRRGGIITGLMTLSCYGIQVRARLAEADMALALFVALSLSGMLLPLLRLRRARELADVTTHELPFKPARYGFLFWIALGAAFLVKGPIALMFTLPPIVLFWLIVRFRSLDRASLKIVEVVFLQPLAMVLGLAMIFGWPLAAYLIHPDVLAQWRYELAARAVGEIRRDSVFAYFGFVPLGTLPWCLFSFAMLGSRDAVRRPVEGLLALWFVSGFVLLSTAIAFKAQHYCLPILLPIILASAAGFERMVGAFLAKRAETAQGRLGWTVLAGWFVVVGAAWIANQIWIEPERLNKGQIKPFAAQITAQTAPEIPIYLLGVGEERVVWYLDRPIRQTRKRDDESLADQIARLPREGAMVICPNPKVDEIRAMVRKLDVLVESADYRGRSDGLEKRALVRVEP